ncbi:MAG TPA: hypothetical protein VJ995_09000 [Geothermobacteraceae bacterium]|nr:hypothetical protein [Geothermobacteraceae bacterium]
MKLLNRNYCWLVSLLLLLAGCGMFPSKIMSPDSQFAQVQDDFMQRLRWRDFQGAAQYFSETHRESFLQHFRESDDLNITDVRLLTTEYAADDERMETEVEVEYFLLPSVTVKTFRFEQQWGFFRSGEKLPGKWRITSHFPEFPGFESP